MMETVMGILCLCLAGLVEPGMAGFFELAYEWDDCTGIRGMISAVCGLLILLSPGIILIFLARAEQLPLPQ